MAKLTDFKKQAKNANKHTEKGLVQLGRSIEDNGWLGAITTANDGEVFAGSARLDKAGEVMSEAEPIVVDTDGTRPVIIRRTDIPNASDPRAIRAGIEDNRVQEVDLEWDVDVLSDILADDEKVLEGLFDNTELLELGVIEEEETVDAEPHIDRAEELLEKWQVKTGDLWRIGDHTLFVGSYESAGLRGGALVYDPPWDEPFIFDFSIFDNILAFSDGQRIGDVVRLLGAPAWEFIWDTGACWYTPNRPLKKHKNCYWYGDVKKYNPEGYFFADDAKPHTVKNTRGEYNYMPDPRGKRLLDVYSESITKTHADGASHSKPVEWVSALLANCTDGDIVDPFCGTGTSIIAAHNIGRRCFASEIDEKMCSVILQRCEDVGLFPERTRTDTVQIASTP